MRSVLLVLTWLACEGRAQNEKALQEEETIPNSQQIAEVERPLRKLAMLLTAFNPSGIPAVGFGSPMDGTATGQVMRTPRHMTMTNSQAAARRALLKQGTAALALSFPAAALADTGDFANLGGISVPSGEMSQNQEVSLYEAMQLKTAAEDLEAQAESANSAVKPIIAFYVDLVTKVRNSDLKGVAALESKVLETASKVKAISGENESLQGKASTILDLSGSDAGGLVYYAQRKDARSAASTARKTAEEVASWSVVYAQR